MPKPDEIRIEELELSAHVGVPEAERAERQRLTVTIVMQPRRPFPELGDDISKAVDYALACQAVRELVAARSFKLIETMAEEIAGELLRCFPLCRVDLELRKFILPDTRYVAVRLERSAPR